MNSNIYENTRRTYQDGNTQDKITRKKIAEKKNTYGKYCTQKKLNEKENVHIKIQMSKLKENLDEASFLGRCPLYKEYFLMKAVVSHQY